MLFGKIVSLYLETKVLQRSSLYSVAEPSLEFCYKYVLVPLQSGPVIQNVHKDLAVHNCLFLVRKRC